MFSWLLDRLTGAINAIVEGWLVIVVLAAAGAMWKWGQGDLTMPGVDVAADLAFTCSHVLTSGTGGHQKGHTAVEFAH